MNPKQSRIFSALFFLVILVIAACSLEQRRDEFAEVKLSFADASATSSESNFSQQLNSQKLQIQQVSGGPFFDGDFGGGTYVAPPAATSEFDCLAVNAVGPGIPPMVEMPNYSQRLNSVMSGASCTYPGVVAGPFANTAAGQSLVMRVRKGESRVFQLFGIKDGTIGKTICATEGPPIPQRINSSNKDLVFIYELGRYSGAVGESTAISIAGSYNSLTSNELRNQRRSDCANANSSTTTMYSLVSVGPQHTCAVTTAGVLKCWGRNTNDGTTVDGRLGIGNDILVRNTPTVVDSGVIYSEVTSGSNFTCGRLAVSNIDQVKCWGNDSAGQLGNGAGGGVIFTPVAATIDSGAAYSKIAAGDTFACGITGSSLKCWGADDLGQQGNISSNSPNSSPTSVSGLSGLTALYARFKTACVLDGTPSLKCWGENNSGKIGTATSPIQIPSAPTPNSFNFDLMSIGYDHVCGYLSGSYYCAGSNTYLQFGASGGGSTFTSTSIGTIFSAISFGFRFGCGIVSGQLKCWGKNDYGQLGDGTTIDRTSPTNVSGAESYVSVSAGNYHTCAITSAGILKCWGDNQYGQLGDGTTVNKSVPSAIDVATP